MTEAEIHQHESKSSVTITQKMKLVDGRENSIVVKQYYNGNISEAKKILNEYDPKLFKNEVKNTPSEFATSSTM